MTITLTPTGRFARLDGHRVQVWEGRTSGGAQCQVFVAAVLPEPGHEQALARELAAEVKERPELERGEDVKIQIVFKDPDALYEPIEQAVREQLKAVPGLDEQERESLLEQRCEAIRAKLSQTWFEWGEYATIEVDTDANTAILVPVRGG